MTKILFPIILCNQLWWLSEYIWVPNVVPFLPFMLQKMHGKLKFDTFHLWWRRHIKYVHWDIIIILIVSWWCIYKFLLSVSVIYNLIMTQMFHENFIPTSINHTRQIPCKVIANSPSCLACSHNGNICSPNTFNCLRIMNYTWQSHHGWQSSKIYLWYDISSQKYR